MEDEQLSVFDFFPDSLAPKEYTIKQISHKTAIDFILPKHYSGRVPSVSWAFGWYYGHKLMAACTFGKPASNPLCVGICGESYAKDVYELNRLCRVDELKKPLSQFVGTCLRMLKPYDVIIVSYSDMGMNHHGYIYQACNFLYTGMTKPRTDIFTEGNKHPRHYKKNELSEYRKVRTSKHRYIYFCTSDKKKKKEWKKALNYPILKYPKGDNNADYELGYVMPTQLIKKEDEDGEE